MRHLPVAKCPLSRRDIGFSPSVSVRRSARSTARVRVLLPTSVRRSAPDFPAPAPAFSLFSLGPGGPRPSRARVWPTPKQHRRTRLSAVVNTGERRERRGSRGMPTQAALPAQTRDRALGAQAGVFLHYFQLLCFDLHNTVCVHACRCRACRVLFIVFSGVWAGRACTGTYPGTMNKGRFTSSTGTYSCMQDALM